MQQSTVDNRGGSPYGDGARQFRQRVSLPRSGRATCSRQDTPPAPLDRRTTRQVAMDRSVADGPTLAAMETAVRKEGIPLSPSQVPSEAVGRSDANALEPGAQQVSNALQPIRDGLNADGYDLTVTSVGDASIEVTVSAREDACEDCLVPRELFADMVRAELAETIGISDIEVVYPADASYQKHPAPDNAGRGGEASARPQPPTPVAGFTSRRHSVEDWAALQALSENQGWGDGLPVVPPTPERVAEALAVCGLEPSDIVANYFERNVTITAENVAVNLVLAGANPTMMPFLTAALQAISEPRFKFNHLASLGSPWPLFLLSGPSLERFGLLESTYAFGPEYAANAQVSRAFSLVLRNCAHAKNSGVQRGQWGNPVRWLNFISENDPGVGWSTLREDEGFAAEDTTLTGVSVYPSSPYPVTTVSTQPERMLDAVCHAIAGFGGAQYTRGTYVLFVGPHHAEIFTSAGWSKADVYQYVEENAKASVKDLKYRGAWGLPQGEDHARTQRIRAGDEDKYVHVFRSNPDLDPYIFIPSAIEGRDNRLIIVVAGGDAGRRLSLAIPYQMSSNPVSRTVDVP